MWNQLLVVTISLVTIFSYLYNYTWEQYVNITKENRIIGTLESNFLPYNRIIKDWYTVNCILAAPSEANLKNKQKTIVYFLNWTTNLSFDCTTPFYRQTDAAQKIQELYWRMSTQCIIEDTTSWFDIKSCSNKATWIMEWD